MMRRVLAFLLIAFSTAAFAQPFPNKPVHLIAPFTAGGAIGSEAVVRSELDCWTKVVKTAGIKPE